MTTDYPHANQYETSDNTNPRYKLLVAALATASISPHANVVVSMLTDSSMRHEVVQLGDAATGQLDALVNFNNCYNDALDTIISYQRFTSSILKLIPYSSEVDSRIEEYFSSPIESDEIFPETVG